MERLDPILEAAPALIGNAADLAELESIEAQLLGKTSVVGELRRGMGQLDPEQRPIVGARVQEVANRLTSLIADRREVLEMAAERDLLASDRLDLTIGAWVPTVGTRHLITRVIEEVTDIFLALGYVVADGPEVENVWYNFDALNTPEWHPSRLESDTLYVDYRGRDDVLMRVHTSPVQARYMEANDPPVYIIAPGRTFRTDTWDATHSPSFHQIEGLVVDKHITFSDLKGTLIHFVQEFFGAETEVQFNPHFFPFTEPSAELHVKLDGTWLEMLGCGVVDPDVLNNVGYDPQKYSGFAFGMGVERLAMTKYGIRDIRRFYENDVRVLRQFP
ncbi:MAG: phenylalanine--tRNA ligase subunit alpha [Acidimicrobiia bacterium]|nr:phenylalanine--tRNA ligase subunit alpha [Acidimicrobiia bacterium]